MTIDIESDPAVGSDQPAKRVGYPNPLEIVERYRRGEAQSLTDAVREYVYRAIKARQAHGGTCYETPASIARRFGCKTSQVNRAMLDDAVVIRTGRDGDSRRDWIVCVDPAKRKTIKTGYKPTPNRWETPKLVNDTHQNGAPNEDARRTEMVRDAPNRCADPPPKTAHQNGAASEDTSNPPSEDTQGGGETLKRGTTTTSRTERSSADEDPTREDGHASDEVSTDQARQLFVNAVGAFVPGYRFIGYQKMVEESAGLADCLNWCLGRGLPFDELQELVDESVRRIADRSVPLKEWNPKFVQERAVMIMTERMFRSGYDADADPSDDSAQASADAPACEHPDEAEDRPATDYDWDVELA